MSRGSSHACPGSQAVPVGYMKRAQEIPGTLGTEQVLTLRLSQPCILSERLRGRAGRALLEGQEDTASAKERQAQLWGRGPEPRLLGTTRCAVTEWLSPRQSLLSPGSPPAAVGCFAWTVAARAEGGSHQ